MEKISSKMLSVAFRKKITEKIDPIFVKIIKNWHKKKWCVAVNVFFKI